MATTTTTSTGDDDDALVRQQLRGGVVIVGTLLYCAGLVTVLVGGYMALDGCRDDDPVLGLWGALGVATGLFLILLGGNMAALT